MNNFTRNELLQINSGISKLEYFNKDLYSKIQFLIDNYCDHKNIGSISDIDYLNICKDCHEIQGWA